MSGLIAELQRDALDHNFPVDSLLRRMKVCAVKLGLPSLEAWVDSELNGYSDEIPEYRKLGGQPIALVNGSWVPMMMATLSEQEMISKAPISQAIGSIVDTLANMDPSGKGMLHYPMPDEFVYMLNEHFHSKAPNMSIRIGRSTLVTVVDKVRNMVLDWAIEMERKGVLGEGMSFEPTERERARIAMTNSSTFNIGSIGSFNGNLGNENISRDIISNVDARSITETVNKIRNAIPDLQAAGIDGAALSRSLDAIDSEANSTKPDSSKLRALFGDVRSMLVGAAGNLTAEGALALITAASNLLGG